MEQCFRCSRAFTKQQVGPKRPGHLANRFAADALLSQHLPSSVVSWLQQIQVNLLRL